MNDADANTNTNTNPAEGRSDSADGDALVKTVRVPLAPALAFELFTTRMASWWPLATHSVGGVDAIAVQLDGRPGGEIVETLRDGTTDVWGTVVRWDPPTAVAFTWHPGRPAGEATDVAVDFLADGEGTIVRLVHTGWAGRDDAVLARRSYDTGWDFVLGRYVGAA